jgi:PTH2 family peptidyl-tRNA hydrolase
MSKMVILMRKDLKMRRGKELSQGAHSALYFLTDRIKAKLDPTLDNTKSQEVSITLSPEEIGWILGLNKKITLQVNSEDELKHYHEMALEAGLESHLVIDAGITEFKNVPTLTCLAIGPDTEERIDPLTSKLKLY